MTADEQRFPMRRIDGSFSFLAQYEVTQPTKEFSIQVSKWLADWVLQNETSASSFLFMNTSQAKIYRLLDDFVQSPTVVACDDNRVTIRFDCNPQAQHWKNWFAMFSKAIMDRFPEVVKLDSVKPLP